MPRLVVLGGSSVSTPALILALLRAEPSGRMEIVLHGRSAEKLALVGRICRLIARDTPMCIEHSRDLDWCLDGADVVLQQVRVGGLQGRAFDEQFPPTLGLIGEETLGAGGFSNALRTIPIILENATAIQRRAPNVVVVNLTNPASLVAQAMGRYANLKVISICDVPVTVAGWISDVLDTPPGSLDVAYLGANHLGWATAARDRAQGGRDRLSEALQCLERLPAFPFDPKWVRALGVIPGPYLRYYYYRDRFAEQPPAHRTRADELIGLESEIIQAYSELSPESGLDEVAGVIEKRRPHWYEEIVVPLLTALSAPVARSLTIQLANRGRVAELPDDSVIELPARVGASGIETEQPSSLPPDCLALLQQNAVYEGLAVESIVERDRSKAVRALVANPLIGTVDKAEAITNKLWPF